MSEVMPTPESSNIAAISYDEMAAVLTIEFNSGQTYEYTGVQPAAWRSFQRAGSKGEYFHRQIKGRYATEQV